MRGDIRYYKYVEVGPYTKTLVVKRGVNNKFGGTVSISHHDSLVWEKDYKTYQGAKNRYRKLPGGQHDLEAFVKKHGNKNNPAAKKRKAKKPKLSKATEEMICMITQWAATRPDDVFPAAMFAWGNASASRSASAAIRYLKKMGMIEVAAKNIQGSPMYRATDALVNARITFTKKNPSRSGIQELVDFGLSLEAAAWAASEIEKIAGKSEYLDYVMWLEEVMDMYGLSDAEEINYHVEGDQPIKIPSEIKKRVAAGTLSNSSYGNDITGSFMLPHHWEMAGDVEELPRLWVFHQNRTAREYEDSERYEVTDGDYMSHGPVYAGEDIKKALSALDKLKNEKGTVINPRVRKGGNWSERVTKKEKYHTPPGLFKKKASTIANTLMRGANGDATKAMRRLVFYMNRAGKDLTNKRELNKAKTILKRK